MIAIGPVLVAWIPISILLIVALPLRSGVTWAFLVGTLFLPAVGGVDLPLFPTLTRPLFVSLGLLFGLVIGRSRVVGQAKLGSGPELALFIYVLLAIATAATNRDTIPAFDGMRRGLALSDGLAMAITDFLLVAVPFVAGRIAHRSPADLTKLLSTYVALALVYSLLALFELRMSPQLHRMLYGTHPHSFAQHVRYGGYRPMIFLGSGLSVALFFSTAAVYAFGLRRGTRRRIWEFAGPYLSLILVLCKSFASIFYGLVAVPLMLLTTPKMVARISLVIAVAAFVYPIMRYADIAPVHALSSLSEGVDAERAFSLHYRFSNEDVLLAHSRQRPLFGYSAYFDRLIVFNPELRIKVVMDGFWIIEIASRGFVGFVAVWAPLVIVPWLANRRIGLIQDNAQRWAVASLSLTVAIQGVDLLPNGLFTQIPYFVAGALSGGLSLRGIARSNSATAAPSGAPTDSPAAAPRSARIASLSDGVRRRES